LQERKEKGDRKIRSPEWRRFSFSDWYETVRGEYCPFKGRSVQRGIFKPLFMEQVKKGR